MPHRLACRPILWTLLIAACLGAGAGGALATGQAPRDSSRPSATGAPLGPAPGDEIVAARTRSSRTFAAEHGALRTRFFSDDVNFKDTAGRWQDVDSTLVASSEAGYAYRNAANSWAVDLPPRLGGAPVRVREDGRWVSFALRGTSAAARVSGNRATYGDAFTGVDVEYAVTGSRVKETLVLANAEAPRSYAFAVKASNGLAPRNADGALEFVDAGGVVRFSFERPFMVDAAGEHSGDVRFQVERSGSGWDVALIADRAWLSAPGRTFPVEVDPTVMSHGDMTAGGSGTDLECGMRESSPTTSYCTNDMDVGYYGGKRNRAMLKWGYIHDQVKRDSLILDAKLKVYVGWIDGGNSASFAVHRMTRAFTGSATWNKYDGTNAWTSAGGDFDSNSYATKTIANTTGWHEWRITQLVQDWADGTHSDFGLMLKQVGETTVNRLSVEKSDDTGVNPQLDITYVPRGGMQPQYTFQGERLTDRSGYGVNVASGNLMVSNQDVSIPGTGPALNITRTYNSVPGGWQGFGAWEMNTGADIELQELENGDVVFWGPNAQVAVFRKSGSSYTNPTGLNAKLEKDQPTTGQWRVTYLQPQSKLIFNSSKKLIRQEDRNGNDITFTYDADGYLSKITDTQDRETTFTTAGDPDAR